ncbi:MAG: hypothetical protein QM809_07195 [Gordonia sp. (in: high G+C Gram-positive bacteria)]|uniref:YncE family protein n=1 Tax=Gordonia sp. (in: high G+C Gram-positive bacteria) TaxID=84139 RepID=UPI0039E3F8DE
MSRRFLRTRAVALTFAATAALGAAVTTPAAHADPAGRQDVARPAPAVPQQAGYHIRGYTVGKGNYRGAIDAQTGALWLTNVSPMNNPSESAILKLDPNTMDVKKRITVTQKADTQGHGTIAAQYEIGVPKTGNTLWTTAAAANGGEANVWDKNTGKRLKNLKGLSHSHAIVFAESIRVAAITVTDGIRFFDMDTYEPLGSAKFPSTGKQLGAGAVVTEDGDGGATITTTSYYRDLTQFRITRDGSGKVQSKIKWNTRQKIKEGHGSVEVDEKHRHVYVNNLWDGLSVYDLYTGKHIKDLATGTGTNAMTVFQGKLYAANYYLGFIAVIDQKSLSETRRLTTGLLPNQLVPWKKDTFLVIDKASSILELPSGAAGSPLPPVGGDHVWKITKTS